MKVAEKSNTLFVKCTLSVHLTLLQLIHGNLIYCGPMGCKNVHYWKKLPVFLKNVLHLPSR
jgi:hypothetical protein